MPLLLNIDTATEHASVCLSRDEHIISMEESVEQKNHASFIQLAIQQVFTIANLELSAVDAITVTHGPGSYTGLRVGLATAKGLCFALQKPLILVNTLEVMAQAAIQDNRLSADVDSLLFCPLIDARRLEVFTAIYDASLNVILTPMALVLDETSFVEQLVSHKIIFSGSGSLKLKNMLTNSNAIFSTVQHNASHLVPEGLKAYKIGRFSDVAYSEPLYLKEFFNSNKH